MYNITIIFSMHMNIGNCNPKELYNIIEKENPEIIFEEFDINRTEDEYYKNGHYKYQNGSTVETFAVMNYLEKNKVYTFQLILLILRIFLQKCIEKYLVLIKNMMSCLNEILYFHLSMDFHI